MPGRIVPCTPPDSIRIEVPGGGVQIPAAMVLAADRVMRLCAVHDAGLILDHAETTGQWSAAVGLTRGWGVTPWAALVALAGELEKGGQG